MKILSQRFAEKSASNRILHQSKLSSFPVPFSAHSGDTAPFRIQVDFKMASDRNDCFVKYDFKQTCLTKNYFNFNAGHYFSLFLVGARIFTKHCFYTSFLSLISFYIRYHFALECIHFFYASFIRSIQQRSKPRHWLKRYHFVVSALALGLKIKFDQPI